MLPILPLLHVASALALCPLLIGIINRTKAFYGGRRGQPLLLPYRELYKLLRKGSVYSDTTTFVFRMGPIVGLATALVALALVPMRGLPALLPFSGDIVLLAYLFGLGRFATVAAALDTGSPFEGMGASREAQFSILVEPALLAAIGALLALTHRSSMSQAFEGLYISTFTVNTLPALLLIAAALSIVLLVECCRIPIDDPNTHLELTMIHEVMVLDHGGVDLAFIQYGAYLKLWILGTLLIDVLAPFRTFAPGADLALGVALLFFLAIGVGILESSMARLRLLRIPQMILTGCLLALFALLTVLIG
jgi:formate hydrogenlyase subunit 4